MALSQLLTCLDIFSEAGLLDVQRRHKYLKLTVLPRRDKADLHATPTMQLLTK